MSPRNFFNFWIVFSLIALSNCARAGDVPFSYPTNQTSFTASLRNGETVGTSQIHRVYLTQGTNIFVFVVPTDFRMDASSSEKVVLSDGSYSCFITIRFAGPLPADSKGLSTDFCRDLTLSHYPGARILNQYSEFAGNYNGPAFDLQWTNSNGANQSARMVFVPSSAGILEFSVLSNSNKFKDAQSCFKVLLASFCSNESGKLEISPIPDQS
jgi:hypothetical protein